MRPYQIAATERILNRIEIADNLQEIRHRGGRRVYLAHHGQRQNADFLQDRAACARSWPYIDKVLFVVDRKDLDYQTMKEYDRFEKGAANSNTSTGGLAAADGRPRTRRIIITTIQKLAYFCAQRTKATRRFDKHVVIIFDECHRSQFGDMHQAITKAF